MNLCLNCGEKFERYNVNPLYKGTYCPECHEELNG